MKQEDLKTIFDNFTSLFNVVISFCSPSGDVVLASGIKEYTYCQMVKNELKMSAQCSNFYRMLRIEKMIPGVTPCIEWCPAYARVSIAPLFSDGLLRGYLSIGPFRQTTDCSAAIQHKVFNSFQNIDLNRIFQELPYIRDKEIKHLSCILFSLTRIITAEGFEASDEDETLLPIIRFMKEYPENSLSLSEAAKIICKSYTRTSHLFVERYGKSFKEVQAEIKIETAEKLVEKNPNINNREISSRVGFEDSSYFLKFYRKTKGRTFQEFRKSLPPSLVEQSVKIV